MNKNNFKKIGMGIVLIGALFLFYETWCPLERIFGIPCPGCNMLSALYHLCLGNIDTAVYFHPLVIVFVFYAILELALYIKYKNFNNKASIVFTTIFFTLLFIVYIYRMINIYPAYPMSYNEANLFAYVISMFS